MENRATRKVRGFVAGAILALLVGVAVHAAPVRADGGGVGGSPMGSVYAPATSTPTN